MDPYNNLDPSLVPQYDVPTPQNDIHQQFRTPRMTQNYHIVQRPPGAETRGLLPPTTQGKHSFQQTSLPHGHAEIGEHANRVLTPFPIAGQTDESNDPLYVPSPPPSAPLSSTGPYVMRAFAHEYRQSPSSHFAPYIPSDPSRGHPSAQLRASSQPLPPPTPSLGDGSSTAGGSPYSDTPQVVSPLRGLPFIHTPTTPLPIPLPDHFPGLPPAISRRHSDADMPSAQNALMSQYLLEHLPAPATYPPFPEQSSLSLRPSNANRISPGFMDMVPGPSPHAQRGDTLPFSNATGSSRSSTSPDMQEQEDMANPMYFRSSSAIASGASSHILDHPLPPPATSSMDGHPERTLRRIGRGRPPKDPRATNRLSDQRKSDDEKIEALCKLFVPPGADVKWKKDRLSMILYYATQLVDSHNRLLEHYKRSMDTREEQLVQSEGQLGQNQSQLLSRHAEFSRMAEHWAATNDSLDHTLRDFEPGLHHQHRNSLMDDQNDSTRPT